MTPSNPDNQQPLIYRIADSAGVFHLVAPVNHTHAQADIDGLADALAAKANAADTETALAGKQNILTFDLTPTADSTNPVTSGGVKAALDGKRDLVGKTISLVINGQEIEIESSDVPNLIRALSDPDSTPIANSNNLVTSGGVKAALDNKRTLVGQTISLVISGQEIEIDSSDVPNLIRALSDPDSTPIANSNNLVTSGGVKAALAAKMDNKTIDSTPTADSPNLVTSGGVRSALNGKMPAMTIDETPTENSGNLVASGGVKAALDGKANTVHTHVASQVEGVMPYYVTYDGNSINLDAILTDPHTMQRLIIENADGSPLEIVAGLFTSPTEHLVIHINNTAEQFVVDPGDYALVTIFKVDRGETTHGHDVCYFAYVEGIFNYES